MPRSPPPDTWLSRRLEYGSSLPRRPPANWKKLPSHSPSVLPASWWAGWFFEGVTRGGGYRERIFSQQTVWEILDYLDSKWYIPQNMGAKLPLTYSPKLRDLLNTWENFFVPGLACLKTAMSLCQGLVGLSFWIKKTSPPEIPQKVRKEPPQKKNTHTHFFFEKSQHVS